MEQAALKDNSSPGPGGAGKWLPMAINGRRTNWATQPTARAGSPEQRMTQKYEQIDDKLQGAL